MCSWSDFTKMMAEYCGQAINDIKFGHRDEFLSPVKRPAFSVLNKTKIKDTLRIVKHIG